MISFRFKIAGKEISYVSTFDLEQVAASVGWEHLLENEFEPESSSYASREEYETVLSIILCAKLGDLKNLMLQINKLREKHNKTIEHEVPVIEKKLFSYVFLNPYSTPKVPAKSGEKSALLKSPDFKFSNPKEIRQFLLSSYIQNSTMNITKASIYGLAFNKSKDQRCRNFLEALFFFEYHFKENNYNQFLANPIFDCNTLILGFKHLCHYAAIMESSENKEISIIHATAHYSAIDTNEKNSSRGCSIYPNSLFSCEQEAIEDTECSVDQETSFEPSKKRLKW